ncbi:hypothetical protein [Methylovirgula sp. HY1]|uniref:hypothetical protein n=1 Tax=Methylovirgula sp. HY1 TaxID=2822761 RepID=UPI001C5ADDD9|nr:hypothetical protein [Methylovirgula sp. HY1]QXX74270.1 hypothetical protein MHY1_01080 [Methylovirgula sp. HY1]
MPTDCLERQVEDAADKINSDGYSERVTIDIAALDRIVGAAASAYLAPLFAALREKDRRISELLAANNTYLERARKAEAALLSQRIDARIDV